MAQSSNLWPAGTDVSLISAVADYLNRLHSSSNVDEDQRESLGVAVQCLQQAMNVETLPTPPFQLEEIYQTFCATKGIEPTTSTDEKSEENTNVPKFEQFISMLSSRGFFRGCEPDSDEYKRRVEQARGKYNAKFPQHKAPTQEDKDNAAALKTEGNALLKSKNIAGAIDKYSQAIELDPHNAVYWCNRAAAYSYLKDFEAAARDAKKSCEIDPQYAKAHIRLGVAHKELGNLDEALQSYENAADLTPPTAANFTSIMDNIQKIKQQIEMKKGSSSSAASRPPPGMPGMPGMGGMDPNALSDMMGSLGGMGGLEGIMKNPMFAQIAQNMMKDPQMMQNMASMMQDPRMADMARNFMGPGGPGGGADADPELQARLAQLTQDPAKMKEVMMKITDDPKMQTVMADPEVGPLLRRLQSGDLSVMMELSSKPDILKLLQELVKKYA